MWPERAATLLDGPTRLTRPRPAGRNGGMARSPRSSEAGSPISGTMRSMVARKSGRSPSGSLGVALWDFMAIAKALADEQRVRLLLALQGRELCLCQLVELVGLAPSTVSKHMSILRQSRLVEGRKDGRWMYYRLAGPRALAAVRQAIDWVRRSLADDPGAARDAERLEAILTIDAQRLCERQSRPKRKPRTK